MWNGEFEQRFRVVVGSTLEMQLETTNVGTEAFRFEEALHTYFAVGDIRQVSIAGLEGSEYIDKLDEGKRKVQEAEAIRFTEGRDEVYINTGASSTIHDPAWGRSIVVEKSGSLSTVVWNPWIDKAPTFSDMDPDGWRDMVCVESANVGENAVTLPPGRPIG